MWKNSDERMKQNCKTKWKANPEENRKQKTESQNSKVKWQKEKTKELLVKQLNTCEKEIQELTDFTKRPNLRIMGIEEEEEVQQRECVTYST
jgi:hypothetical protein